MSNHKKRIFIYSSMLLLAGCANYRASSLTQLRECPAIQSYQQPTVSVACKIFDKEDCKIYLGRDVIKEGYVPMQVAIRNNLNDPLFLNREQFNIPLAPPQEVAKKMHTSTAGRMVVWGVSGLIFTPLLISAIYDGIKSSGANRSLDADYFSKSLKEASIAPQTSFNALVFVPKKHLDQSIEMILVNERTQEKIAFSMNP